MLFSVHVLPELLSPLVKLCGAEEEFTCFHQLISTHKNLWPQLCFTDCQTVLLPSMEHATVTVRWHCTMYKWSLVSAVFKPGCSSRPKDNHSFLPETITWFSSGDRRK